MCQAAAGASTKPSIDHNIYPAWCRCCTEATQPGNTTSSDKVKGHGSPRGQSRVSGGAGSGLGTDAERSAGSGQIRERASCPLGLVKCDKKIRVCFGVKILPGRITLCSPTVFYFLWHRIPQQLQIIEVYLHSFVSVLAFFS